MRNEDRIRLRHMIDAAESAAQFIAGRRRADLDMLLRHGLAPGAGEEIRPLFGRGVR